MFKWKKIGQIFDPTKFNDGIDRPWMKTHSQCPNVIIFDDFIRVFFSCRPEPDENNQYVSYTTFLDLDKNDLTKIIKVSKSPILELGELGTFDEFGVYPTCVINKDAKLFLYYAGWTRLVSTFSNVAIGLAISNNDGVSFERIGKGPIMTRTVKEPFVISGPKVRKINNLWYMYYLAGEKWVLNDKNKAEVIYKIRLATSNDGLNWNRSGENIINFVLDDNECQAGPDVFYYEGKYHMYFSYKHGLDFRNKERGYKIGYAYSNDGINWIRDDNLSGIKLSESGWDSEMMHYPHIFKLEEKIYMLYNGNDFGRYGLGLAELERRTK